MTFDETMHKQCDSCGKDAQQHRLTKAGVFYCLKLNGSGRNRYEMPFSPLSGVVDVINIVYTCPVRYLKRSPLSHAMGKAIQGYLSGTVTA